ncbi:MAG: RNB domain-containing ribonuclease [Comamonadaceae bacterium]|jgi:exoribonuclease-2|uniref:RNB domain-containing ribonuclease n=1 Tax=Hydrogenophaga borbori TaxID=2294117 RepID=A0A372ELU4_9BURK|nr:MULTISPECIES: RNB domain-containing ribonuclease [Hydrogenophaga]NCT96714.1 RNB domain-containing ribonuclease [Comamonadaceae bacterium]RFP80255.1 RNB domain-containing ribonuclease [Hydrogenophaga borbori]WQB84654.1 RNB domain-containing ribonuclease [Hydrogenophaga sp. SNF1]
MHILFDEAGKFLTGRLLSESDSSLQVELDSGKRVKVKAANALLRFEKPAPAELLKEAGSLAEGMELELAYEFAPEDEFGFADLAREYFSAQAGTAQQVAALLTLQNAPHYFRRAGKGRFKKAPPEIVAQALAAIEKKKELQARIEAWAAELVAGRCPEPVHQQLYRILFKPDKNGPEYKAVVEAARLSHTAPLVLLQQAGAIRSAYQFHWQRFLFEHFPKGTGFPALSAPPVAEALPLAAVAAFSIDDSATTEIDDALSVQGLGSGTVTLGIHIAAPGLAIAPGDPLDELARTRLSTVYMPGHKITMLPDAVVDAYTLQAGRDCPAVSLYVEIDEATLAVGPSRTALERVPIAHNLRHDRLDTIVTEAWLAGEANAQAPAELAGLQPALVFLHRFAREHKAQREIARGKPETFTRPDYTFKLEGVQGDEPAGDERVLIGTRSRGAPLDLMVAEAMILANKTWGLWLAECGVPGIYRSQASLLPGIKVRMGTKALPHAGIGVKAYTWATSPLRRYVDLVNQWQIVACARHGKTAALAAPFKPKDANLLAVVSAFDAAHTAYNGFQGGMERYWTLQYLRQNGITELTATLIKDGLVRADTLPLVLPVLGADGLQRGAHLRIRLGAIDDITLELSGTVIERLDQPVEDPAALESEAEEDEEEPLGAPVALAIDLDDAAAGETPPGGTQNG